MLFLERIGILSVATYWSNQRMSVLVIAFIAMICAYVYVLRHLRNIEKTIVADNLVPSELGPRNNMVLMVCLIPLIATALLLYLVIKT